MSDAGPEVLCVGRLYCDLVFTGVARMPSLGTETFGTGLGLHAGGGAFITAAAFGALGWKSALAATLPASPFDQIVSGEIAASGVDAGLCVAADPDNAPQITVAIAAQDDRAFLSHKSGAAVPSLVLDQLPATLRHLHIGELRTACEQPELITLARAAGLTISLDCAWDDALLSQPEGVEEIIRQVDVFLPNEDEMNRLTASGFETDPGTLIVVKCGDKGARAQSGARWIERAAEPVSVIDATGAGDAFNGGFVSAWLEGQPLEDCLSKGNHCGAAAVQSIGGTGGFERLRGAAKALRTPAAE